MMETLRADFKKIPSVLSGEFGVVELPPAKPQPEKPKQAGLF
jgi:hypothetical protein